MKDLRCKIGLHKDIVEDMEIKLHHGIFGGPVTYFNGYCKRCKRRFFRSFGL